MEKKQIVAFGLSGFVGAILFSVVFAAAFNGSWPLAIFAALAYGISAALAVGLGGARPLWGAVALLCPALPWLLWLFPASISEAGWLQASLGPASVLFLFLLAWLTGTVSARYAAR